MASETQDRDWRECVRPGGHFFAEHTSRYDLRCVRCGISSIDPRLQAPTPPRAGEPEGAVASEARGFQEFRCDDAAGFALRVLRAPDGDFHLSIVPRRDDMEYPEEADLFAPCYSASVRVRMPMVGGGSHPALYDALVALWRGLGLVEPAIAPQAPAGGPEVDRGE